MIRTEGLTKKFGEQTAVDNLSLDVSKGEVFGFLGPNGAGKTTTVRMLCCLIGKTSGTATIDGNEVGKEADSLKIRRMIGLVPDNVGLYEVLSAYKNLDFYARLYGVPDNRREENIKRYLTMLGLWEKRDVVAGAFSKGMKQKLAIARALVHDPDLLFMDEPTANLDPESAKTVRDFILELKKEKRTIFLNTHNLDEAQRVCDRIAILNTKLMAMGTPSELEGRVGVRKVAVELETADDRIVSAISKRFPDSKVAADGAKLTIETPDADKRVAEIISTVVSNGGKVRSAGVVGSNLEETYLKLVREED